MSEAAGAGADAAGPPALGAVLGFCVATLVGGALLAPPAFWLGRTLVQEQWLPQLAKFGFGTYLRRSWLVCGLLCTPALARRLPRRALDWRPGARTKRVAVRQLALGLALGGAGVATLLAYALGAGWLAWRHIAVAAWATAASTAAISAAAVALAEEVAFRGVLLRGLERRLPRLAAATLQLATFAAVHFVGLAGAPHGPHDVGWSAGLRALAALLRPFAHPAALWPQATTLLAVGAALTVAARRAGTLWPAIGVHAAWVFGLRLASQTCARLRPADIWLDHELRAGLAPTALALLSCVVLAYLPAAWLRGGEERTR